MLFLGAPQLSILPSYHFIILSSSSTRVFIVFSWLPVSPVHVSWETRKPQDANYCFISSASEFVNMNRIRTHCWWKSITLWGENASMSVHLSVCPVNQVYIIPRIPIGKLLLYLCQDSLFLYEIISFGIGTHTHMNVRAELSLLLLSRAENEFPKKG